MEAEIIKKTSEVITEQELSWARTEVKHSQEAMLDCLGRVNTLIR